MMPAIFHEPWHKFPDDKEGLKDRYTYWVTLKINAFGNDGIVAPAVWFNDKFYFLNHRGLYEEDEIHFKITAWMEYWCPKPYNE